MSYLGRDNYLVQSILRLYGHNAFYNTSDGSSDKNDEDIQDVQKYLDDSDITGKLIRIYYVLLNFEKQRHIFR